MSKQHSDLLAKIKTYICKHGLRTMFSLGFRLNGVTSRTLLVAGLWSRLLCTGVDNHRNVLLGAVA